MVICKARAWFVPMLNLRNISHNAARVSAFELFIFQYCIILIEIWKVEYLSVQVIPMFSTNYNIDTHINIIIMNNFAAQSIKGDIKTNITKIM